MDKPLLDLFVSLILYVTSDTKRSNEGEVCVNLIISVKFRYMPVNLVTLKITCVI